MGKPMARVLRRRLHWAFYGDSHNMKTSGTSCLEHVIADISEIENMC
jgi:hypothetical protein